MSISFWFLTVGWIPPVLIILFLSLMGWLPGNLLGDVIFNVIRIYAVLYVVSIGHLLFTTFRTAFAGNYFFGRGREGQRILKTGRAATAHLQRIHAKCHAETHART